MKILIPLLLVFLTISCNKQEKKTLSEYQKNINKKITQNKPFFDFDEVVHYQIQDPSNDYYDSEVADTVPTKKRLLFMLLRYPCPVTQEEKKGFKEALEFADKEEYKINPKYNKELNWVFSEKKCDNIWEYACAPTYRDIFIFKKNKEEIGIAKICFECQLYSISNKDANTRCFNMNGELDRLSKIILENKKNK
ncbi:hypothetical protein [Flavobacterium microcysteis]|uniref:Lipoprotein n=1 Tax=Flavobacterium microcysteis TaxID=2596891 RepID=A0A501Q3W7_9FLAO|nr:hypothetical protein [Flavobacterium microcysteis]TPD66907.1 hypothetical protein FJA49_11515 [Flavobacterium microcysteis]